MPALAATHACSGALKDNSTTPSVVVMPVVLTRTVSSVTTTSNGEVSAEPEVGGAVTEAASWVVEPDEVPVDSPFAQAAATTARAQNSTILGQGRTAGRAYRSAPGTDVMPTEREDAQDARPRRRLPLSCPDAL